MKESYSPKTLGAMMAWALFLLLPLCETSNANPVTLDLYNPTGAMEITEIHASRLDTLEGKTICELSNDTWQAHRVLPEIRRLLKERYPTAKFIPYDQFPMGNNGIDSAKAADLAVARGCQAVVIGDAG